MSGEKRPFFSVVIPTYNRFSLLAEAVESVFQQEYQDYELIVVDDGSTDKTPAFLGVHRDRLFTISQNNMGASAARNAGVLASKGEYVVFLDSDDVWFPWTLATYASVISLHGSPSVIMGRWIRPEESATNHEIYRSTELRVSSFSDFLEASKEPVFWATGCAAVRRDVLISAGGFSVDLRVFEDKDMGLRLGTTHDFIKIQAPATVLCRLAPGSLMANLGGSLTALRQIIGTEKSGGYPGGCSRKWERRNYITYSVRSVSMGLVRAGRLRDAFELYRMTLSWHAVLGRFRYLVGFPFACLTSFIRPN